MSKTETTENITQDESNWWGQMGCRGLKQDKKDTTPKDYRISQNLEKHTAICSFHIMLSVKAVMTLTSDLQKTGQSCYLLTGAHCFKPR